MSRRQPPPLPPREGLSPSRVRVPNRQPMTAYEVVLHAVLTQRHRHPDDGPNAVLQRFREHQVALRDVPQVHPYQMLDPGTDVWFYRKPAPEPELPFEAQVIYRDEYLTVVDKPPFMAVTPRGRHITQTLIVQQRRRTGNEELSPAHRLDRLTSGLVVCTNHAEIRGQYQQLFEQRRVSKVYHALVPYNAHIADQVSRCASEGRDFQWSSRIKKRVGVLQAQTVEGPPNTVTRVLSVEPLSSPAVSGPSGRLGTLARYVLQPLTGKTHQLRVHMAAAGVPILNDPLYPAVLPDAPDNTAAPLALRAAKLGFVDPLTGEPRTFRAPAKPAYLSGLLD